MILLAAVRFNHNHSMVINSQSRWTARLVTLVLWALAAASLAWWGLRLWGGASSTSVGTTPSVAAPAAAADPAAVARLLGAAAPTATAAPVAASRFVLLGVMASPSSRGAALIAVDGKPGRAFRVGSRVDEGLVLEAVEPRKARLAQATGAGETMVLEMPASRK